MAAVDTIERYVVCGRASSLMAGLARCGMMRDIPPRVCEGRGRPIGGRMASRAGARSRETRASVVRNGAAKGRRAIPFGGVATVAIEWRHGGTGVAKSAGHRDVRASQGEAGGAVVKDSAQPIDCRVARPASGGIGQRNVVRDTRVGGGVCRVLILESVATVAGGWQRAAVISTHVAQRAGRG